MPFGSFSFTVWWFCTLQNWSYCRTQVMDCRLFSVWNQPSEILGAQKPLISLAGSTALGAYLGSRKCPVPARSPGPSCPPRSQRACPRSMRITLRHEMTEPSGRGGSRSASPPHRRSAPGLPAMLRTPKPSKKGLEHVVQHTNTVTYPMR